ncbi:MAG: hypothetical protein LBG65_04715 [Puniceicoccales bacterium]|jgi:hypothetical protein|nr:hypothetical protein [Puniceicoccales bacterium]
MLPRRNPLVPSRLFFWLAIAIAAVPSARAAGPQWWKTPRNGRTVFAASATANDYAAANIGQLKHIALHAKLELDEKLASTGGAGAAINALITAWNTPANAAGLAPNGKPRNDYAALTVGQLKAVGKLFYDRLAAAGILAKDAQGNPRYPWSISGQHASNAAVANIGQLKAVFSFVATVPAPNADTNGNGIADVWELRHFLNLSRSGNERLTAGGLRVRDAYLFDLNPNTLNDGTGSLVTLPAVAAGSSAAVFAPDLFTYDSRGWLNSAKLGTAVARAYNLDNEGNINSVTP